MLYDITPEELDALKRYAQDEDSILEDYTLLKRFLNLQFAVMGKMAKDLPRQRAAAKMYRDRLERLKARKEAAAAAGEFSEAGFDTVEVARALVYRFQQLKTYPLSMTLVMAVLYDIYATWLKQYDERLFIEHPVAQEKGPWFWRVSQHVDLKERQSASAFSSIAERNPAVAAIVRNAADKYHDYKLDQLLNYVMGTPYRAVDKQHNGGKWNGVLRDADIYEWKKNVKKEERK